MFRQAVLFATVGRLLLLIPIVDCHGRFPTFLSLERSVASSALTYPLGSGYQQRLYYTRIELGSPPKEFRMLLDTGSDIVWVLCNSERLAYSPRSSATASLVNCSHPRCHTDSHSYCSSGDTLCKYTIGYGDGTSTSGYYIQDLLHFNNKTPPDSSVANGTAQITFGCSTRAAATNDMFVDVDGILALGRNGLSFVSQLAAQRIVPRAFSHCLSGVEDGSSVLAFGAPSLLPLVYTPMVSSGYRYYVTLLGIHVNGKPVPVAPTVFAKSGDKGTFVDSGTAAAYLIDEAYEPLLNAITVAVPQPASLFLADNIHCYRTLSSVDIHTFPEVALLFEGMASMLLGPEDYINNLKELTDDHAVWCLGFQRSLFPGITILGEAVLRNKIVVYDLGAQRIGWVNHNCSVPFNISTIDTGGNKQRDVPLRVQLSLTIVLLALWLIGC